MVKMVDIMSVSQQSQRSGEAASPGDEAGREAARAGAPPSRPRPAPPTPVLHSGPPGLAPTLCPLLLQLLSKYDPQKEAELRGWIEGLTGLSIGPDFQKGLRDGVILCT